MTEKFEKTTHLPVTPSGPKPGDFPIGSPESRAAARNLLESQNDVIETRIVYNYRTEPPPGEPVGEVVLEGKTYEVYGPNGESLYPKIGTRPLPRVRLPRPRFLIRLSRVA